jgi:hypothetical protein
MYKQSASAWIVVYFAYPYREYLFIVFLLRDTGYGSGYFRDRRRDEAGDIVFWGRKKKSIAVEDRKDGAVKYSKRYKRPIFYKIHKIWDVKKPP